MKEKRIRPLILILLLSLVICAVLTFFSARQYHGSHGLYMSETETPQFDCTISNNNVEVTEISLENDELHYTIKPLRQGYDKVVFTAVADDVLQYMIVENVVVGPFGLIFTYDERIDFDGSTIVNTILLADIWITTIYMLCLFLSYRKRAEFGYAMITCGGIAIFFSFYLLVFVADMILADVTLLTVTLPFSAFIHNVVSSGVIFIMITFPFMLLFSLALIISNISLIRHEGFRVTNLLGVILGSVWLIGMLVTTYFNDNASGSALHGTIFDALTNSVAVIVSYFVCMLASTVISAAMAAKRKPEFDRDYIVILGCAIRGDGSPTPLLKGRIDAALSFEKAQHEATGKHAVFVPSGGQGSDEIISESEAMKRYLLEQGVPEERILTEDKSVNTYQNLEFSKKLIDSDSEESFPAVATTNYHVFRSYVLAKKVGLKNMRGLSAKTKWYFFPNAFLREFVGLIVAEKLAHIIILVLMTAAVALLSIFTAGI